VQAGAVGNLAQIVSQISPPAPSAPQPATGTTRPQPARASVRLEPAGGLDGWLIDRLFGASR
jgi:penicillin-binding protein 1A